MNISVENNKVVYLHKDSNGIIRYVGSGTKYRANRTEAKSKRGADYEHYVNTNGKLKVEIVAEGLTRVDAENLERKLYDVHINTILNYRRPTSAKHMTKEMFESYMYYDESSKTGLRWKVDGKGSGGTKIKANSEAGSLNKSTGYYIVQLKGNRYKNHRVIMVLHDFCIEGKVIDHIDRDRVNNKISNLRAVTHKENMQNRSEDKLSSRNTSGVKGVHYDKTYHKWVASFRNGTTLKQAYFPISDYNSSEEAFYAACACRKQMQEGSGYFIEGYED